MIFNLHFMCFYRGFFISTLGPRGGAITHRAPSPWLRACADVLPFPPLSFDPAIMDDAECAE